MFDSLNLDRTFIRHHPFFFFFFFVPQQRDNLTERMKYRLHIIDPSLIHDVQHQVTYSAAA
jgi:hypothetical protein